MTLTYDAEIEQIVQVVFATMLHTDVERIELDDEPADDRVTASIRVSGERRVEVNLLLPRDVAVQAAASMLGLSTEEVTQADQVEVAAELANMIGGNLKSLLPSPSQLTIPTVKDSSCGGSCEADCAVLTESATRLWFISPNGPFAVHFCDLIA